MVKTARRDKRVKQRHVRIPAMNTEQVYFNQWYALKVASQKEIPVQNLLTQMGLMTYVPVRSEYKHRNKYDKANKDKFLFEYPELSGYVMIGFSQGQYMSGNNPHWLKIFEYPNILGIVSQLGIPKVLNPIDILNLMEIFPHGLRRPSYEAYMRTNREYSVGDIVEVCSGPFEGHKVPVIAIDDGKSTFEVNFLGSSRKVDIDSYELAKSA